MFNVQQARNLQVGAQVVRQDNWWDAHNARSTVFTVTAVHSNRIDLFSAATGQHIRFFWSEFPLPHWEVPYV